MDWKEFFKLKVYKETSKGAKTFFEGKITVPDSFPLQDLNMSRFDGWELKGPEKKKFSLGVRKILLCHDYFNSTEFLKLRAQFHQLILEERSPSLNFSTHGGGIYLFMNLPLSSKRIVCQTSELPLSIVSFSTRKNSVRFIYRPQNKNFLADFPSLWEDSELLCHFELKDYKNRAS